MHPREETLVMGLDRRYVDLVLELLARRAFLRTGTPALFEIGYAGGGMLTRAVQAGYEVAGLEVCETVRRQALRSLPERFHPRLHLGDLLAQDLGNTQYDVVYWNDVFEHIPPDEIRDYLARIYRLLLPGGHLVTITPNWHERPSDVTGDFLPPRSEARGLHLKEYTLREVTGLLRETGFARVETPLVVTKSRIVLGLGGLSGLKRLFEPCLEWIPYRSAELLCHGLGLSYTIATKE
jgi:SAM-dependent methyltransferase